MTGGGMRQAGILAAAGIFALENNIQRLAEDHRHAEMLAEGLSQLPGLVVDRNPAQTNMVFFTVDPETAAALAAFLKERRILISPGKTTRLVTHLDISEADINTVLAACTEFFSNDQSGSK